ncbi:MAG: hypothetical protein Tsb007_39990 [Rhizobacter sp.]
MWQAFIDAIRASNPLLIAGIAASIGLLGALTAAAISLINTWMTNRQAFSRMTAELAHRSKELTEKLKHDAEESHKERVAALRRAVYIEAVDEVVKAMAWLGSLTSVDITEAGAGSGLEGLARATSKVTVVADEATALKARELNTAVLESFFRLLRYLPAMHLSKSQADHSSELYDEAQLEIKRILSDMTRFNEDLNTDQVAFDALRVSLKNQMDRARGFANDRGTAQKLLAKQVQDFGAVLMKEIVSLTPLQDELLLAVRGEVGMSTDTEKFMNQSAEIQLRMQTAASWVFKPSITEYPD